MSVRATCARSRRSCRTSAACAPPGASPMRIPSCHEDLTVAARPLVSGAQAAWRIDRSTRRTATFGPDGAPRQPRLADRTRARAHLPMDDRAGVRGTAVEAGRARATASRPAPPRPWPSPARRSNRTSRCSGESRSWSTNRRWTRTGHVTTRSRDPCRSPPPRAGPNGNDADLGHELDRSRRPPPRLRCAAARRRVAELRCLQPVLPRSLPRQRRFEWCGGGARTRRARLSRIDQT